MESFVPEGPAGYFKNSDLGGEEKSGQATEECFRRGQMRPQTEVILVQTFF